MDTTFECRPAPARVTAALVPIAKPNPAIALEDGLSTRTVWGFYLDGDADVIGERYPTVGAALVRRIAGLINDPRLLEVLGIVEVVHRYVSGAFSAIKKGIPEGLCLVANPLSVLFWNEEAGRVQRIVAPETELLHKAMEKLALRTGSLAKINALLDERFGLQLAFGCSCCVIATATGDLPAVLASEYYWKREQLGRRYDSDVLAVRGDLFLVESVGAIPETILETTADFKDAEVASYLRLDAVAKAALAAAPPAVDVNALDKRARCFLGGYCACPANAIALTPADAAQ